MFKKILIFLYLFPLCCMSQTNHYVWFGGNHTVPFTNWFTAATNIQDAIDTSSSNDIVLVTNGVYDSGGVLYSSYLLTNRVLINKPITVKSINGPQYTTIVGKWDITTNGDAAIRGVYMAGGSRLIGFTIISGATRNLGSIDRQGGGVYAENRSIIISNCYLVNNSAHYRGGGVYNASLYDCIISNNLSLRTAGNAYGAGAFNSLLIRCKILNNTGQNGGGAYLSDIYDSELLNNIIDQGQGGGAISSTLSNCVVSFNGGSYYGGGVSSCTIYDCYIYGNSATHGGGIFTTTAYNCLIIKNIATGGYGGGAYRNDIYNSLIYNNTSYQHGGGVYDANLYNCTIVGNSITTLGRLGGGIYNGSATNCIIYYNNNFNYSSSNYYNSNTSINFSCSAPMPQGSNNIDLIPLFADHTNEDYRLSFDSPCINSGTNFSWMTDFSDFRSKDLDNRQRVRNFIVDMGAYEAWSIEKGILLIRAEDSFPR